MRDGAGLVWQFSVERRPSLRGLRERNVDCLFSRVGIVEAEKCVHLAEDPPDRALVIKADVEIKKPGVEAGVANGCDSVGSPIAELTDIDTWHRLMLLPANAVALL